ncbi:MAG TPA: ParB/RepB/Spo0J family partition protein [Chloroflexota bacterium]|nr:ParB/RepB/Spo0J family partition protein [Chloroflexota bacterium]
MARTRTLKIGAVVDRPLDQTERRALASEAARALNPVNVANLPVERIAETPEARNSRRGYDETKLNELAASIREHGVLQPILVTPDADGYRVIAGNRRLKATIRAGLETIPALIKTQVDEHRQFFLNLVENVQRVDLTGKERVEAIQLLAASGLGVREISRGTGISPGTISRWLRIADRPILARALEEERLDIARAMTLAPIRDEAILARLLDDAPSTPRAELNVAVQAVLQQNTYCLDDGRLADVDRKLALVRTVTDVGAAHLRRIQARAAELLAQIEPASADPT